LTRKTEREEMNSTQEEIRLEDFRVQKISNFDIDVILLKIEGTEKFIIFEESTFVMLPEPENPAKMQLTKRGRQVENGKIIIEVFSGGTENQRYEDIENLINLRQLLPSASPLMAASRASPEPPYEPLEFNVFTVDVNEWDSFFETLLMMKLVPL
jgi:hypothetical protein